MLNKKRGRRERGHADHTKDSFANASVTSINSASHISTYRALGPRRATQGCVIPFAIEKDVVASLAGFLARALYWFHRYEM